MARVWEFSAHGGSELLMLLAIGDFADDAGEAYPSISTLAQKCRTTSRYAIKLLDALVASGELQVVKHGGVMGRGGMTNRYRILLEQLGIQSTKDVNQSSVVNQSTGSSAPGDNEVVHQGSPKPSLNHQEPPKEQRRVGKQKSDQRTFRQWYESAKPAADAIGDKVIPLSDPIRGYLTKLGLDREFLILHFEWFKEKYLTDAKKQKDWLATFRNSIKGNWAKLWYRTPDGAWRLTVAGKQFALAHDFDPEMQSQPESDWTGGAT